MLLALSSAVATAAPGCVGKMWNPIADLDFTLMGGVKVAGMTLIKTPSKLGDPPEHDADPVCFCKNGLKTGFGLGLTFWMPSYINDMARKAGCLGFLGGLDILPGFVSQSSGQEYNMHAVAKDGVTSMQVHWVFADVTAIAGKSLFEKCNAVTGSMSISYMTELDFIFQNDVYSVIMTPQASILAAVPLLSQMACGYESIANTLGDWQDFGLCAWKGTRLPFSGNSIAKDSAQVSNMDITLKYLTRSALLGTTLKTMGPSAQCAPSYSPFYDPFQHRYQWSYPAKTSTRYNVDMLRWGVFLQDNGPTSMVSVTDEAVMVAGVDSTLDMGGGANPLGGDRPTVANKNFAEQLVAKLPKPLNYPSREAGYMQVWEARQCCLMVFTIETIIKMVLENMATMGNSLVKEMYDYYNMANKAYKVINDPVGAGLDAIGSGIAESLGDAIGNVFGSNVTLSDGTVFKK